MNFGFVKRGMAGFILQVLFDSQISYYTIAMISFIVFIIVIIILIYHYYEFMNTNNTILFVCFIVSPGFVFSIHEIGYLDQLVLLILAILLLFPLNNKGFIFIFILSILAITIHEEYYVMWFPIIITKCILYSILTNNKKPFVMALILTVFLGSVTYIVGSTQLSTKEGKIYTEYLNSKAKNFEIRDDAVSVLYKGGSWGIFNVNWSMTWLLRLVILLLFTIPFSILVIYITLSTTREISKSYLLYSLISISIILSSLSPLALNIFGTDYNRYISLTHISSFITLLEVQKAINDNSHNLASKSLILKKHLYIIFAITMLGITTNVPLFDDYHVRNPPYLDVAAHIQDIIQGKEDIFTIPNR